MRVTQAPLCQGSIPGMYCGSWGFRTRFRIREMMRFMQGHLLFQKGGIFAPQCSFLRGFFVSSNVAKKYNVPLDPNEMPRSGGIATMMRLPQHQTSEGLDACFVGIPLDTGTSNRSGTRQENFFFANTVLFLFSRSELLNDRVGGAHAKRRVSRRCRAERSVRN